MGVAGIASDASPIPALLSAATVTEYSTPFVRFSTVVDVCVVCFVTVVESAMFIAITA